METLPLPLPIDYAEPATWPQVCLAEVWQPQPAARIKANLAPTYQRRLFAAQDWQTIYGKVDRCSLHDYNKRPVVITRYQTSGTQLPFVLQAVTLGMALPRLYAVDGLLKPHQLQDDRPRGAMPLLGQSGTWLGRNWNKVRQIWQETGGDHLRALGFVKLGSDKIAIQPISHDCTYMDRREWAVNSSNNDSLGTSAQDDFYNAPIVTEAHLVARVIKLFKPHYRLNRGLLEKLRLHAHKDDLAPKAPIRGQTTDYKRPQYDWLVILSPPAPR